MHRCPVILPRDMNRCWQIAISQVILSNADRRVRLPPKIVQKSGPGSHLDVLSPSRRSGWTKLPRNRLLRNQSWRGIRQRHTSEME